MIDFDTLMLQNFFRIGQRVEWNLKDQGLVLILGHNYDSDTADSNGAGKSTLFEGLVWVIWGKTVRGYTGDQVVNRDIGQDCAGSLDFFVDGKQYQILRTRKHTRSKNSLELWSIDGNLSMDLTGHTVSQTQTTIDQLLGIDFDTFIRGPMMPQGSFKRFSEMTDAETKHILDQVVQLDVISRAKGEAMLRAKSVQLQYGTVYAQRNAKENEIEDKLVEISELEQEAEDFHRQQMSKVYRMAAEIAGAVDEYETELDDHTPPAVFSGQAQEAATKVVNLQRQLGQARREWNNRIKKVQNQAATLRGEISHARAQLRDFKKEKKRITNLQGACPTCLQDIDHNHVHECVNRIELGEEALTDKLKEMETELTSNESAVLDTEKRAESALGVIEMKIDSALRAKDDAQSDLSQAQQQESRLTALQVQTNRLRKRIQEEKEEPSPFQTMIDKLRGEVVALRQLQARLVARERAYQLELQHLSFWIQGFGNKGIKSLVLDSVTPYLNSRARHHAKRLTGDEFVITFHTQKVLKSGDVRESFSVKVENRNGAEDYAGNSGGERSKADLAINFSLSDLVSSRARKAFPQRFFDEPFENLDEQGVEAVVTMLQEMAQTAGSIFVISHQDHLKSLFNKVLTVEKRNGCSQITT